MPAQNQVDLVIVIDTSSSMRPCIDQLKRHLKELINPMQGYVSKIRFGLVGLSASFIDGTARYRVDTLPGGGETVPGLYGGASQYNFLSDDTAGVIKRLDSLKVSGDEDNLVALDLALDHPFGPIVTTKRVVALFSDEKLEAGVRRSAILSDVPKIVDKLHSRRIKLFCAMPYSDGAQLLSEANGSEIEDVGGNGLAKVDFRTLLGQMGKSISISSVQSGLEERYQKAIFGQDEWSLSNSEWLEKDHG
jgi:hypothetical protein